MLEINSPAIDFTLKDENGKDVALSSFIGKKIVLYFYPKDNTPGCTTQAKEYRDLYDEFKKDDYVIIGISKDSVESHKKFKEKYNLPFILLSDPDLNVINKYHVYKEKKLYGKSFLGVVRTTFVIDENGIIRSIKEKVNPKEDASCQLSYLRSL
ncbi:MAG: thioredoxin-dependent thiol peroxidase [Bacilli bacterium]